MDVEILKMYEDFLNSLVRQNSSDLFTNDGIEYASRLMSILIKNTRNKIIMYCGGFKKDLIKKEPYWSALQDFLKDKNKKLSVLVSNDEHINEEPLVLLRKIANSEGDHATITVKRITDEGRAVFAGRNFGREFHFSVFDDKMFRFETDIQKFEAIGSFNRPEHCKTLTSIFNQAFQNAELLF